MSMQTRSPPSSPGWGATAGRRRPPLMTLDSCSSNGLADELLRVWPSLPYSFLRETCFETRLHVVPKRLPRDLSQVGGPPGESPRALPEEGAKRAFLCNGRRFPLGRHGP